MKFEVLSKKGKSRRGRITFADGRTVETPVFMPVATQAAFKAGIETSEIGNMGAEIMLGNTYHLGLRPGSKLVGEHGGLRGFSRNDSAFLTDSGGFQVFSLPRKVTRDGVTFRSHVDGKKFHLTPERSLDIQSELGTDIAMQLDVCPPGDCDEKVLDDAMKMTTFWARRTLARRRELCEVGVGGNVESRTGRVVRRSENSFRGERDGISTRFESFGEAFAHAERVEMKVTSVPDVFAIVQGGTSVEKRLKHLEELKNLCHPELDSGSQDTCTTREIPDQVRHDKVGVRNDKKIEFAGFALGGLAVGEEKRKMRETIEGVVPKMPEEKPRYLMGVGTPADIRHAVANGVDMFDCVLPARNARHGVVFFGADEVLRITNASCAGDLGVIDDGCDCEVCAKGFSRAYLHHLFRVGEVLGQRLATIHNLRFYLRMMEELREELEVEN